MNRPAVNLRPSILEVLGGLLALVAFLASDPDALSVRGREPSPTGNVAGCGGQAGRNTGHRCRPRDKPTGNAGARP